MAFSLKSMARRRLEKTCAAAFSAIFVLCSTPVFTDSTASTAPCTSASLDIDGIERPVVSTTNVCHKDVSIQDYYATVQGTHEEIEL